MAAIGPFSIDMYLPALPMLGEALGSTAGIFGISSVDYVGPIADALNGVDVSIPASAIVGLLIYALLERAPKK